LILSLSFPSFLIFLQTVYVICKLDLICASSSTFTLFCRLYIMVLALLLFSPGKQHRKPLSTSPHFVDGKWGKPFGLITSLTQWRHQVRLVLSLLFFVVLNFFIFIDLKFSIYIVQVHHKISSTWHIHATRNPF
jgi:hypothetical protein